MVEIVDDGGEADAMGRPELGQPTAAGGGTEAARTSTSATTADRGESTSEGPKQQ